MNRESGSWMLPGTQVPRWLVVGMVVAAVLSLFGTGYVFLR
jgi:hypothetical protein